MMTIWDQGHAAPPRPLHVPLPGWGTTCCPPWQAMWKGGSKGGFKHYFIEHDNPADDINSMAYSYNTVRNLRFNSTYELPY